MGNTVFISDIDKYFKNNIIVRGYVPSKDPTDPSWKLEKVPVSYHLPEGGNIPNFEHNLVTFFLYDMQLDRQRCHSDLSIVTSVNEAEGTVIIEKLPIPYVLYYQIDLWSLKQTSLVQMVQEFQRQFPPRTSIFVEDADGDEHDLFLELGYTKNADGYLWSSGTKQSDERFFRRIFRYKVYAELETMSPQVKKMAKELRIDDPKQL